MRAVLWREYLFCKRRWWTITTGSMVAPLLYLVAFGWGLGKTVNLARFNNFVITPMIFVCGTFFLLTGYRTPFRRSSACYP